MLELHVTDNDVTGGNVAVSWCTDKELLKELADEGVKDPQLVVIVSPDGDHYRSKKEYRKVIPLGELMSYVEFRVPGKNKVWAFVSRMSAKGARDEYLRKVGGDYYTDVLSQDGSKMEALVDNKHQAEPIDLYVPEACFAPEPSDWEKEWVNLLFHSDPIDQCHFRKRRLFAYTVQVVLMMLNVLVRVPMVLLALLIGARNLSAKYLLHPIRYSISDTTDVLRGGSYFIRKETWKPENDKFSTEVKYCLSRGWTLIFMPLIFIPVMLLALFGKWAIFGLFGIVFVGLSILAFGFWFFAEGVATRLVDRVSGWYNDSFGPKEFAYLDAQEMDMLVCNGKPMNWKTLPSKKKTFRLRFSNLKSKVCRPFSA